MNVNDVTVPGNQKPYTIAISQTDYTRNIVLCMAFEPGIAVLYAVDTGHWIANVMIHQIFNIYIMVYFLFQRSCIEYNLRPSPVPVR